MLKDLYKDDYEYINDPEGCILPYRMVSRTDREVLEHKYYRLRKSSRGLTIRLGLADRRYS